MWERFKRLSTADLLFVGKGKKVVCCRFIVCGKGLKGCLLQIYCMWERFKRLSTADLLYMGKV